MKEPSPPVSAMATPTNGGSNLVDEFEESFQLCLNALTKDEAVPINDKDEMKVEVENTTLRFIDLARQMEAFFLQKRFLLSALRPEMIVKEDISELRLELARKEELLRRHYEKIAVWQNLLSDLQGYSKSPLQSIANVNAAGVNPGAPIQHGVLPNPPINQPPMGPMAVGGLPMQQHLQQQQLQHLQQQQLQQQMQQQLQQQMQAISGIGMGNNGGMAAVHNSMYMQHQLQNQGSFFQSNNGILDGPLAYLEKTTSNIGIMESRR